MYSKRLVHTWESLQLQALWMNVVVCLTSNKHLLESTKSRSLTCLNAGRDGQHGDDEAQAAVDSQEEFVEEAGLGIRVVNDHEDHGSHRHGEQHQCDQSQSCVPDFIILHPWAPVDRQRQFILSYKLLLYIPTSLCKVNQCVSFLKGGIHLVSTDKTFLDLVVTGR